MDQDNQETAVRVDGVYKDFILPHEKVASVKKIFTHMFNSRIFKDNEIQHALRDISFEVKKGEFFGIVGRNGSGKSTLLKIIAGIYQPTKGSIKVDGRLVPFIELGVGFNPELTGRENVYLNGAMMGFSQAQTEGMYKGIVAFAELEEFMDQKLKNYSSGMQVRLAFSVAVKAEADILLVDEVLAVGDADFQRKCYEYFKSLKKQKKTVIFVSHSMDAVREYCDRAILIDRSRIMVAGRAQKVAQRYFRLFNEGVNKGGSSGKDAERWGNGWAKFHEVTATVTDENIRVELEVIAQKDIQDVVYGIRLRNGAGDEVLGTNSIIKGKQALSLKAKDKVTVVWEIPNILSNGVYYIDPALVIGDGATVCDWWDGARSIEIFKEYTTNYPVTPDITLNVSKPQHEV